MPYNQDDPRSQLATMTAAPRPAGASFPAQYFELGASAPDEVTGDSSATWFVRSQSCALAYSEAYPEVVTELMRKFLERGHR